MARSLIPPLIPGARLHPTLHRYDARGVDTWCAGVCLYTMVTGNLPFQASNVDDALDALRTKEPMFPKQLSPLLTVSDGALLLYIQ